MTDQGHRMASAALKVFYGRKGFDEWWHEIDNDIQDEILEQLRIVLAPFLLVSQHAI